MESRRQLWCRFGILLANWASAFPAADSHAQSPAPTQPVVATTDFIDCCIKTGLSRTILAAVAAQPAPPTNTELLKHTDNVWGDHPVDAERCIIWGGHFSDTNSADNGFARAEPLRSFGTNRFGLYDMPDPVIVPTTRGFSSQSMLQPLRYSDVLWVEGRYPEGEPFVRWGESTRRTSGK